MSLRARLVLVSLLTLGAGLAALARELGEVEGGWFVLELPAA